MELFDLNIETILENWEIYHAIREIISNALDEQTITKTKDVQITHSKKQLIIRDFGRGLHYKNLTQKENPEKLNHPTVIGKFGIGLKDALATFDRNQLEVLIKSKHHDISLCKSPKKGFADVETIHAKINQSTEPNFIGTEVTINGVSEKDLNAAKELFVKFSKSKLIEETKTGQVYKKSDNSNVSIYVNGVKIAEEESFLFSYNIIEKSKALSKALNRERSHVGRDAYTESIKKILLQCKSESLVNDLCKDLENMTNGSNHDELKWIDVQLHVVKIRNNIGNVIFVTANELMFYRDHIDLAKSDGKAVIVVPDSLINKIRTENKKLKKPIVDIREYISIYNKSFQYRFVDTEQLTEAEKKVFIYTEKILLLFGGKPNKVKHIKISETMRPNIHSVGANTVMSLYPDIDSSEVLGCWDESLCSIVINRNQLISLDDYAGTLIHELIHAKTGYEDVSRNFEYVLTKTIGKITKQALT